MQDAEASAKAAVELVRIFKELSPDHQAATLEFVKKLAESSQRQLQES